MMKSGRSASAPFQSGLDVDRVGVNTAYAPHPDEDEDGAPRPDEDELRKKIETGEVSEVKRLIVVERADVNHKYEHDATPAYVASEEDQPECLKLLIENGADVNLARSNGRTPTYIACSNGHTECLTLLIESGADAQTPSHSKRTPLDAARGRGHAAAAAIVIIATLDKTDLTTDELKALKVPGLLEVALSAAFAKSRLRTLERVAYLVERFRAEADRVKRLDVPICTQFMALVLRVQQAAVGLLRALDAAEVKRLLGEERGARARMALVLAECKVTLADVTLQQATAAQWSLVSPEGFMDAAMIALRSVWHAAVIAVYPPFEKILVKDRNEELKSARTDFKVEEENKPSDDKVEEENKPIYDGTSEYIAFKVDGKVVSSFWRKGNGTSDKRKKAARATFFSHCAEHAEEKAESVLRLYPILEPAFRFYAWTSLQLLLAVLLTALPAERGEHITALLLVWTVQLAVLQAHEAYANRPLWAADPLNMLEMPASILASGGLILRFAPSLQNLERALLAGGILLMFVSQTLRLLERSPKIGPLVLMAQKMIPDTLRFLSLIIGPVVGIAFSMVVLFKGQSASGLGEECFMYDDDYAGGRHLAGHHSGGKSGSSADSSGEDGSGSGIMVSASSAVNSIEIYIRSTVAFFEILLGSNNQLGCLRASTHPLASVLLMDGFLVMIVLVGSNMLIALMAKTFAILHEQQETNYMFLTSLLTVSWANKGAVPPPFAVLGLPYLLISSTLSCTRSPGAHVWKKMHTSEEGEDTDEAKDSPEYLMRKHKEPDSLTVREIHEKMKKYLKERVGDQGEDDKYRTQMAREQAQIKAELAELRTELIAKVYEMMMQQAVMMEQQAVMMEQQAEAMKQQLQALDAKVDALPVVKLADCQWGVDSGS